MRSRAISCLSIAGAAGALAVPASASAAGHPTATTAVPVTEPAAVVGGTVPTVSAPLPKAHRVLLPLVRERKAPYVRRDVRLARRLAHIKGDHLEHGYADQLRAWPLEDLKRHEARLRHAIVRARREARAERRRERAAQRAAAAAATTPTTTTTGTATTGGSTASGTLQSIAQCESGGNPSAVDPTGTYRGKYQFTYSTWAAMGGTGDPAAAPEAVQDAMAAKLYSSAGAGQWPVCGR